METKGVEQFYNSSLRKSKNKYEYDRWFKTSQGRASFHSTKSALLRYALPMVKEGMSVLEVGPGPGTWSKFLLAKTAGAPYKVVDISEEMLKQAKENLSESNNVTFVRSDILEFVPEDEHDFFFSSRFIENVPDKRSVVKTIAKGLKKGGRGYIVTKTPQYNRPLSKQNNSAVHQNQISAEELKNIFLEEGFAVNQVVNVTSVFPGLRCGPLDRFLTILCSFLPYSLTRVFSESYALIFEKK